MGKAYGCPGALVCVVGRVGTGKSALLSGLLGDMRHSKGETVFCDTVSYGMSHPSRFSMDCWGSKLI